MELLPVSRYGAEMHFFSLNRGDFPGDNRIKSIGEPTGNPVAKVIREDP
jgi:hypothetical protein